MASITIFIAPAEVAKPWGRYICLLEGESGKPNTYLRDDSLVEIARQLGDRVTDWQYIENALHEKGVFRMDD